MAFSGIRVGIYPFNIRGINIGKAFFNIEVRYFDGTIRNGYH